jgi:hypothetical protein
MEWRVDAWWPNGVRWELAEPGKKYALGRVLSYPERNRVSVIDYISNEHNEFDTMKEAAEWLVKKVTNGTGVL